MKHKPLIKEKITDQLREQITAMRTDSLVRIAPERALAEDLGISRVSLKAAINNLVNEGLLVQIQGKGTYITPLVQLHTLHVICSPDIKSNDPFYNKFLVEITNLAAKKCIHLFMVDPLNFEIASETCPLIVVGLLEENLMNALKMSYRKIIAIQDYANSDRILQVYFDDYRIGCNAAQTLYEHGHRKVIHLAGPERYPSAFKRRAGFLEVSNSLGLKYLVIEKKMNWSGGYSAGEFFFEKLKDWKQYTAVFAANDWMAVGFMQRLKEKGLRIPEDVSIIGCDDIPLASEYYPQLTTFNLDMRHLVEVVFSSLNRFETLGFDDTDKADNQKILIPAKLIHRDSLNIYKNKRKG